MNSGAKTIKAVLPPSWLNRRRVPASEEEFYQKAGFSAEAPVAMSIVLWAVVMDIDNPERNMRFDDVPVRVIRCVAAESIDRSGTHRGREHNGHRQPAVAREQERRRGPRQPDHRNGGYLGLTEANEYDLPVTVSVSKSGVETNYVNPGKVHVRVDRVESRMFRSRSM